MSVMTENTLAGSGGLLRCANNALMDWIMSPSSGQAIIWCWLTESNRRHPAYKAGALPAELNQLILKHPARAFLVDKLVTE